MQINAVENILFPVTVTLFGFLINRFDNQYLNDGSLPLKSLKDFLGAPVFLCPACQYIHSKISAPFYTLGSRFLRADKSFMRSPFLINQHGEHTRNVVTADIECIHEALEKNGEMR